VKKLQENQQVMLNFTLELTLFMCFGRVNIYCSAYVTRRVTLVIPETRRAH